MTPGKPPIRRNIQRRFSTRSEEALPDLARALLCNFLKTVAAVQHPHWESAIF